jgi:sugar/nucleoside kinase (ribokinase family)
VAQPDAIVAGLICLDIIPHFGGPATLTPGKMTEIGAAALATGGAVANTGLALHRLGIATGLMGKLGDDLFGQAVLGIVRGVDPALAEGMAIAPGETSSYTIVLNPPNIDRVFFHCPGANHTFGAGDVDYDLVAGARLFHLGYPPYMRRLYAGSGRELGELYRRVKALGVTTTLDMALPDPAGPSGRVDWPALLTGVLPYVDLFLPSAEELCFMLDRSRYDALRGDEPEVQDVIALAARCLDLGAKVVVVKCGARGLYARTAGAAGRDGARGSRPSRRLGRARSLVAVFYTGAARRNDRRRRCHHRRVPGRAAAREIAHAGSDDSLRRRSVQRRSCRCPQRRSHLG